jgi:hypothetical protein
MIDHRFDDDLPDKESHDPPHHHRATHTPHIRLETTRQTSHPRGTRLLATPTRVHPGQPNRRSHHQPSDSPITSADQVERPRRLQTMQLPTRQNTRRPARPAQTRPRARRPMVNPPNTIHHPQTCSPTTQPTAHPVRIALCHNTIHPPPSPTQPANRSFAVAASMRVGVIFLIASSLATQESCSIYLPQFLGEFWSFPLVNSESCCVSKGLE